jgi:hypothetical protein
MTTHRVFQRVNWEQLRLQKECLVRVSGYNGRAPQVGAEEANLLCGVVALLDHFQDCAAEGLGEKTVFGDLSDEGETG